MSYLHTKCFNCLLFSSPTPCRTAPTFLYIQLHALPLRKQNKEQANKTKHTEHEIDSPPLETFHILSKLLSQEFFLFLSYIKNSVHGEPKYLAEGQAHHRTTSTVTGVVRGDMSKEMAFELRVDPWHGSRHMEKFLQDYLGEPQQWWPKSWSR